MRDWKQIALSSDWTMYHLPDDTEVWLVEHACKGTVAYDDKKHVCSECGVNLPSKLLTAMTLFLNKDKIRV